jgi:hypothetical protein
VRPTHDGPTVVSGRRGRVAAHPQTHFGVPHPYARLRMGGVEGDGSYYETSRVTIHDGYMSWVGEMTHPGDTPL